MRTLSLLVLTLTLGGCMAPETKQLVRDHAAVSDADYRDLKAGKLKPGDIEQHFLDDAKTAASLNYSINGVEVPPQYATAPVTSGAVK